MIFRAGVLLAAMFALFPSIAPGAAPADAPASATIQGACDVAFLATATLHDVPGTARCLPFTAVLARDAAGRRILPTVEVDVPVAAMDTGNKTRDGKMREMFQSDRYPRIHAAAPASGPAFDPTGKPGHSTTLLLVKAQRTNCLRPASFSAKWKLVFTR